ncbi:hypothetical protein JAAARDRAFT_42689 [Jaapia argillacea MUCL 33604]|uniref:DUF6593 domain-containing protein n=1 Tax=Jaapia argillacea MUCL 33604 TaxID=933084 RepID=A0A067P775_9AGAM|nr:hypothetical protein JAAARDRAFT_42689 [Jaapia argillacea MUCL 33604]
MEKRLTFTNSSPIRTVLKDEQDQPVYKIDTPIRLTRSTTTITRCPRNYSEQQDEELARIHWHVIHQTEFVFQGKILKVGNFLQRTGFLRRDWKFTAPDGREYKWNPRLTSMELILNDGSDTVVASFREGNIGIFSPKRSSCLEIFLSGQHMIDIIVVTFVYAEQRRRESRDAASSG